MPAAAWLLLSTLCDTVAAVPHVNRGMHAIAIAARQTDAPATPASPTDPWVSVDESGRPKTVTPVLTTIDGTPTVISGAPYELTGTVFTQTRNAAITTSTGVPAPTATGKDGSGSFALCKKPEGDFAPFCEPKNNATIYPGKTHYVTWDPAFFKSSNTTIRVVGFYNETEEAFSSDLISAGWGFYQWKVESDLYKKPGKDAVNITLRIASLPLGSTVNWVPGPTIIVTSEPAPEPTKSPVPQGEALYIALPTVLGFVALMVVGTCIWNRKHRKIGLGNVMGRGRNGYGVGKSRRQRLFGKGTRKEQAIGLMERDGAAGAYRDHDDDEWKSEIPGRGRTRIRADEIDRPRRDSDALGSLAGTPTRTDFDFSRPGESDNNKNGANVFRAEMERQEKMASKRM
ncbi:hypothetical protein B0T16DRAFT_452841 [Cercophora newfieldiana]|uniref:Uncharacterized protein n=1 Tax=Cercophora newfieldiana TaxID=92897 RepID=A0AA39YSK1_9PEZI|nr:hypothetical protein B0T16DRAFT_452841 [Cercophora newfieldiana]